MEDDYFRVKGKGKRYTNKTWRVMEREGQADINTRTQNNIGNCEEDFELNSDLLVRLQTSQTSIDVRADAGWDAGSLRVLVLDD